MNIKTRRAKIIYDEYLLSENYGDSKTFRSREDKSLSYSSEVSANFRSLLLKGRYFRFQ